MNELGDAVDGQPLELPFVEFTEEAFHDIGPGGPGGDEVEVDPGISGQPVPDFFVLVRGVVVEDDVDLERSSPELCVKVRGSSSMLLLGCLGDLLRFEKREIQVATFAPDCSSP